MRTKDMEDYKRLVRETDQMRLKEWGWIRSPGGVLMQTLCGVPVAIAPTIIPANARYPHKFVILISMVEHKDFGNRPKQFSTEINAANYIDHAMSFMHDLFEADTGQGEFSKGLVERP